MAGRVPHPRNRQALATVLGVHASDLWPETDPFDRLVPKDLAGVQGVYASRSAVSGQVLSGGPFCRRHRRSALLDCRTTCLCQQFADHRLEQLLCLGTKVSCLFLDPDGQATAAREVEEGYEPGHLAGLTRMNISLLQRLRSRLPEGARDRLFLAKYDQTIRFNIIIAERPDETIAVVQAYLPHSRGVDSPTFVIAARCLRGDCSRPSSRSTRNSKSRQFRAEASTRGSASRRGPGGRPSQDNPARRQRVRTADSQGRTGLRVRPRPSNRTPAQGPPPPSDATHRFFWGRRRPGRRRDELRWVLDPIDGTVNFVHGLPLYAVSLALTSGQQPVLGVIDLPALNTRYHAAVGLGAFCGEQRLAIPPPPADLAAAIVAIGDYAVGERAEAKNRIRLGVTTRLAATVLRVRMLGAAAIDLAWLAQGAHRRLSDALQQPMGHVSRRGLGP